MLLNSDEMTAEIRTFEAFGEIISNEGAATVASYWYSISVPQLTMLATHTNPFADSRFDLDALEAEARTEQKLMMVSREYSDREKARYTRDFEALYAWIADQQLNAWIVNGEDSRVS